MPDLPPEPHRAPPTPATTTAVRPAHTDTGSLAPAYFDALYAEHGDPWAFATSPYEAAKYAATLAALPRPRYRQALEIGCSVGVLTEQLARPCEHLLAVDVSEAALAQARERCASVPGVRFERRALPAEMPEGPFDLIVLSEVAYYWSEADFREARRALARVAAPGAHLLLVHYTGETNYPLTADAVHDAFGSDSEWAVAASDRAASYRLDLLERA